MTEGQARADQPPPRMGPRPLPLHLAAPMMLYGASVSALPILKSGWPLSKQSSPADLFATDWLNGLTPFLHTAPFPWPDMAHAGELDPLVSLVRDGDLAELYFSIDGVFREQIAAMMDGVTRYWAHPFHRMESSHKVVWAEGATRVLCYAEEEAGPPVLVVPSLVNKSYIMDLEESCSFCLALASAGLIPYLVDWGEPGQQEQAFGLGDYIERLDGALTRISDRFPPGQKVGLVGYCMGGLLALPLAIRQQSLIEKLVLLATPWDFHAGRVPDRNAAPVASAVCDSIVSVFSKMPVDWIQAMFMALDPLLAFRKFQNFATLDPDSPVTRRFVLLEDWLNDGVSLTGPVARETLVGWYAENATGALNWRIGGEPVDPSHFLGESLVVIPTADRIVPPESALAITERLEDVRLLRPALGHIGMMSSRSADRLWGRVAKFLL